MLYLSYEFLSNICNYIDSSRKIQIRVITFINFNSDNQNIDKEIKLKNNGNVAILSIFIKFA